MNDNIEEYKKRISECLLDLKNGIADYTIIEELDNILVKLKGLDKDGSLDGYINATYASVNYHREYCYRNYKIAIEINNYINSGNKVSRLNNVLTLYKMDFSKIDLSSVINISCVTDNLVVCNTTNGREILITHDVVPLYEKERIADKLNVKSKLNKLSFLIILFIILIIFLVYYFVKL